MRRISSSHSGWRLRLLTAASLAVVVFLIFDAIFGGLLLGWLAVTLFDWRFRSVGATFRSEWWNGYGRRLSASPVWTAYKRRLRESARARVLFVGGTAVTATGIVVVASVLLAEEPLDVVESTLVAAVLLVVSAAALGFGVWLVCDDPDSDPLRR